MVYYFYKKSISTEFHQILNKYGGCIAEHKACEFHEYWLKMSKIAILGVSPARNTQTWADWGQIWQGVNC